jgi:REP element-mobilizing transposase RayT
MRRCRRGQIELPLRERTRWGGRRAGAGRKPGTGSRVRHRTRERFEGRFPCHATIKVRQGLPSLRSARLVRELERSLVSLREVRREFRVVHYSIQRDHVHLIVEAKDRAALGRGMKAFCARLARAVNRVFRRSGAVLAERYHSRVLRTPREVRSALRYVLLNARKHARGPARAEVDPASSGRFFDGWRGRADVEGALPPSSPPVARARTWLLRRGWRRHGLIDLAELPGRLPPGPRGDSRAGAGPPG